LSSITLKILQYTDILIFKEYGYLESLITMWRTFV